MNRNKVNVFICEKITPKLRALRYLDGDALEAELKQVIGDTQHAFDITENDVAGGSLRTSPRPTLTRRKNESESQGESRG